MISKDAQIAQLRGKLGAQTRRLNLDRAFCHLQVALEEYEKTRGARYRQLAHALLRMVQAVDSDTYHYAAKGIAQTLAEVEDEYEKKVAARREIYEATKDQP